MGDIKVQLIEEEDLVSTPIDYYQFFKDDFNDLKYFNDLKLVPDSSGFVTEEIISSVLEVDGEALKHGNKKISYLINSGVGQGKTSSLLELAKYYSQDYIVIILSPFEALVEMYMDKLTNNVEDSSTIFNMKVLEIENIEEGYIQTLIKDAKIHVLTVNLFLRNAGDLFYQKHSKQLYLDNLINYSNSTGKQLVVFFDELHASIENFDFQKIIQYFRFRNIVSKQFFLSATFNNASKIIINYLLSLTNRNLCLIQNDRIHKGKESCNLNLILTDTFYSTNHPNYIRKIVKAIANDAIEDNKKVFVLSYSKSLAAVILNDEYREELLQRGVTPKLLVSGERDEFNEETDTFVIGTKFNTGISFSNGNYIIILPPKDNFRDKKLIMEGALGIFSEGGADTVIQSVARLRNNGSIYIVLPNPTFLLGDDTSEEGRLYTNSILKYKEIFNVSKERFVSASTFNSQDKVLINYYESIKKAYLLEIHLTNEIFNNSNNDLPNLNFPTYEEFAILYGKKYINLFDASLGYGLVPFIIKSAFTNQFSNCTLKSITYYKLTLELTNGKEKEEFVSFFNKFLPPNSSESSFENSVHFESQFMSCKETYDFIISYINRNNIYHNSFQITVKANIVTDLSMWLTYLYKSGNFQEKFTDSDYFLHQMYAAKNIREFRSTASNIELSSNEKKLIYAYKSMYEVYEVFVNSIQGDYVISNIENSPIKDYFKENIFIINEIVSFLNEFDVFVTSKKYNIFRPTNKDQLRDLERISPENAYKYFKKLFFEIEADPLKKRTRTRRTINEVLCDIDIITQIKQLPISKKECLNLIYNYEESLSNVVFSRYELDFFNLEVIATI